MDRKIIKFVLYGMIVFLIFLLAYELFSAYFDSLFSGFSQIFDNADVISTPLPFNPFE